MKYVNETVRRQDRLMDEARAIELLSTSEYGVLSMVDQEGTAYGVPLNFVWDGESSIYMHCAPGGRKLEALEKNPNVSFCIIGNVNLLPGKFTTEYESVVLKGVAHILKLVDKLSPDFKALGAKYSQKSFHRVNIIRIDFSEYSGKCKHVHTAD